MLSGFPISGAPLSATGVARSLVAAVGTFSLVGNAATFPGSHTVIASQGAFTLSGLPAGLGKNRTITAGQGTFYMSGQATGFGKGITFTAQHLDFALTGKAASLKIAAKVASSTGSFALTGNAVALPLARLVTANKGTFSLDGQSTSFGKGYAFSAEEGYFALAGKDAYLRYGSRVTAAKGTFALTGKAATLLKGKRLSVTPGVFTLSGQIVSLVLQESTVGKNQVAQLPSPVNATGVVDSNTVRSNDNIIATAFSAHDADASLHVQSGTLAYRPASLSDGSLWVAADTQDSYLYTGGGWKQVGWAHWYGTAYDTTTQTVGTANTDTLITLNSSGILRGVSLVSGSQIKVAYAGDYNLQFSVQLSNSDASEQDAVFWIKQNGVTVPDSGGYVTVHKKHGSVNGHAVATYNVYLAMAANDYAQVYWQATNTSVSLETIAATGNVARSPSIILTINRI